MRRRPLRVALVLGFLRSLWSAFIGEPRSPMVDQRTVSRTLCFHAPLCASGTPLPCFGQPNGAVTFFRAVLSDRTVAFCDTIRAITRPPPARFASTGTRSTRRHVPHAHACPRNVLAQPTSLGAVRNDTDTFRATTRPPLARFAPSGDHSTRHGHAHAHYASCRVYTESLSLGVVRNDVGTLGPP